MALFKRAAIVRGEFPSDLEVKQAVEVFGKDEKISYLSSILLVKSLDTPFKCKEVLNLSGNNLFDDLYKEQLVFLEVAKDVQPTTVEKTVVEKTEPTKPKTTRAKRTIKPKT